MKIALVDGIPEKSSKSWKGRDRGLFHYPFPLLKLGTFAKSEGHEVHPYIHKLPSKEDRFDEVWLTTIFTFHIPYHKALIERLKVNSSKIVVGGISATLLPYQYEQMGVEVFRGLHPIAELCDPDYSLLPSPPEYSIVFTSRGCVRKCEFCMVRRLEPKFINYSDWTRQLAPNVEAKQIKLSDNNFIAKPFKALEKDVDILKSLVAEKRVNNIDINQAMDARLMTKKVANLLSGLPIDPIRFAFDNMETDGHYQKAINLMVESGFKNEFLAYMLYNYKDTPQDFYYRLKESVLLTAKYGGKIQVGAFPMEYRPILDVDFDRSYVGENWTTLTKKNIRVMMDAIGTGTVSTRYPEDFEYYFGKDEAEFTKMLHYPALSKLTDRKKAKRREMKYKRRKKKLENK